MSAIEPLSRHLPTYGDDQTTLQGSEYPQKEQPLVSEQPTTQQNRISYVPAPSYVVPLEDLGDHPEWIDCPYCKRRAQTEIKKEHSSMT